MHKQLNALPGKPLKHCIFILCDAYALQLLIKDIMEKIP